MSADPPRTGTEPRYSEWTCTRCGKVRKRYSPGDWHYNCTGGRTCTDTDPAPLPADAGTDALVRFPAGQYYSMDVTPYQPAADRIAELVAENARLVTRRIDANDGFDQQRERAERAEARLRIAEEVIAAAKELRAASTLQAVGDAEDDFDAALARWKP